MLIGKLLTKMVFVSIHCKLTKKFTQFIPIIFLALGTVTCRNDAAATTEFSSPPPALTTNQAAKAAKPEVPEEYKALPPQQLDEFAAFAEAARERYDIPGMAVAIVQGSDIVFVEGFGVRNIEGDDPITPETLFHIGSTHKSVTAMLIATLVDDDLLDWDTPVVEIDPEFELSDPKSTEQVTIRHLLSMSSGIPDEAEDDFDVENSTAEDVFDLLAQIDLLDDPGEVFSYSNLSSSAAGYIGVLAAGATNLSRDSVGYSFKTVTGILPT